MDELLVFRSGHFFGLDPSEYSIAIIIFTRCLGAIFIVAYLPFLFQMQGLFGKDGIRPIAEYLDTVTRLFGKKRFYYVPTLFWLNASDAALKSLVWIGMGLGLLLMLDIYTPLILVLLYLTHLSLTSAGQEFLSFGWETLLMEITIATFLTVATTPFNVFGWIGLNFLLLRFYFQSGISKILSQDKNWRNLTAISYHYLTQPLPNTTAWYFHKFPMWFHKISTFLMFYIELIVPFAIFSPPEIRLIVFIQLAGLQWVIWLTGNLSYLNHLTIAFCLILLHNRFLEPFFSLPLSDEPSPLLWQLFISVLGILFLFLQILSFMATFFSRNILYHFLIWTEPFHLAYPHGIFAIMTTKRYEIIFEGSNDGHLWQEYQFFYKPGALSWRPRRISPYQPRLDWQAWFLPFGRFYNEGWVQAFLTKLLEGSPAVGKLLKYNPFPETAPLFIRAVIYDYEFTTFEEKAQSGNWWKRRYLGEYAAPIRLRTSIDK